MKFAKMYYQHGIRIVSNTSAIFFIAFNTTNKVAILVNNYEAILKCKHFPL